MFDSCGGGIGTHNPPITVPSCPPPGGPPASPSQTSNYLTGSYPGADNVALQVQRKENDVWVPFADVQAQVRVGTFETYVITSRTGGMKFRVFDPTTKAASNAVGVIVG